MAGLEVLIFSLYAIVIPMMMTLKCDAGNHYNRSLSGNSKINVNLTQLP